jgi:hypothetical protein
MKKKFSLLLTVAALLLPATVVFAQKKNQLEGAWKIVEVTIPAGSPTNVAMKDTTISDPQPGLIIFTKGYYSVMAVRTSTPRTAAERPKDVNNLTDAEKIARFTEWSPLLANSGTYEIKGSTLIRHPIVAKSAEVMNSQDPLTNEFKIDGNNTLFLNPTPDHAATEPRAKLKRVE